MSEEGVERFARGKDLVLDLGYPEVKGWEGSDGVARDRGLVLAPGCREPKNEEVGTIAKDKSLMLAL